MARKQDIKGLSAKNSFSKDFGKGLLNWNKRKNKREMPWKGEKDPYKIWLSEIILQQTRVEQGHAYYQRFIEKYSSVKELAKASEQEVFKLWEGLGYYSRCKNLITTAKFISEELNGIFPETYEEVLALKGVGSYTAAAITSFAYNAPYAVLDGNVFRILSRIYDIDTPIDTTEGKQLFSSLARQTLDVDKAGEYNQAIMDFGATVCKPLPECPSCFFNNKCKALLKGKQTDLPVKLKKIAIKERWFNYLIINYADQYAIRQRTAKDIWEKLFEFLLVETTKKTSVKKVVPLIATKFTISESELSVQNKVLNAKQRLSHQIIHFQFIKAELRKKPRLPEEVIWVKASDLKNYPFPRTLQQQLNSLF
jgi:A/G-specific adenine glycosylase